MMRADILISALIEGTAPVLSVFAFLALLFMATVNVRVKNRRRVLSGISASMTAESDKAIRAQRATDFLHAALRRSYYVVGLIVIGVLWILPYIPMAPTSRILLWASLSGMAFVGPGIMFLNFRNRDHDGESNTRQRLHEAEVRAADSRILEMYDQISGLYTKRFWLKALELRVRRRLRRYAPITCLLIELPELNDMRKIYNDSVADEVVAQFACHLRNNMRSDDLGARIGYNRFAVAAMRCPADKASIIGQRIVHNASQVTIIGDGLPVTFNLKIRWLSATSPAYTVNPSLLLRTASMAMDRDVRRPSRVLVAQPLPSLRRAV
jgi:diguanylate cyclase (GGDEF)-like protein